VSEEVVRSLLWFHPAVWWLISRVQLARETVVDELSILTTNTRRAYLDTLLAFADDTGLRSSPAFSARRQLFHRVMLLSKEEGMSSIRIAVASCLLAVALGAGAVGAVQAFPLYASEQVPPPPPPRDPLSPGAYHRMAAEYARAALEDAAIGDELRLTLIRKGIAAEERALELRPEYPDAMLLKAILLRRQVDLTADPGERARLTSEANEMSRKSFALAKSGIGPNGDRIIAPPPPPPPGGHQMVFVPAPGAGDSVEAYEQSVRALNPVRVGGNIRMPEKIRDVKPIYPPIAQQAGVQGVVILETLIDAGGNVVAARILRSIPLLDQAALDAVKEWKYSMPLVDGQPQALQMTVTVNFKVSQ
jgi:protein TonB